ncbi:MAG: helical backbone metal receptor, partial [Bacteroidota bacterium]
GNKLKINESPQRIISLVPSITELLFDLGLDHRIVGRTKFCIHPKDQCKKVVQIGGTKSLHFDRIAALEPDLIIGNKEENDQQQIEYLKAKYPVWLSDVITIEDALSMIFNLGILLDCKNQANALLKGIQQSLKQIKKEKQPKEVAYLIWREPMMAAAQNTFINSMIETAGWKNTFADLERYPEINIDLLKKKAPDYLFLSSEPFPFKEKHIQDFQQHLPNTKVRLIDGELFSWYGSRMQYFGSYVNDMVI